MMCFLLCASFILLPRKKKKFYFTVISWLGIHANEVTSFPFSGHKLNHALHLLLLDWISWCYYTQKPQYFIVKLFYCGDW